MSIEAALAKIEDRDFRDRLKADDRPFGDGYASERIFKVLKTVPVDASLFRKRITY
jgi:UDP-N-acetylglucosamine 2-epimerase